MREALWSLLTALLMVTVFLKKSIRKVYSFSSNNDSIITSLLDMKRLREMLLDDHINILSSDVPLNQIIFYKEHKPLPLL